MERWIDIARFIKYRAPGGAFDIFAYGELISWFPFTIAINPVHWKWAALVLIGTEAELP